MTRLTLIAIAAFVVSPSLALADEIIEYDRSKLTDEAYTDHLREKIKSAARKECRPLYRGELFSEIKTRQCVRETVAVAMAELDAAKQTRFAEAAS